MRSKSRGRWLRRKKGCWVTQKLLMMTSTKPFMVTDVKFHMIEDRRFCLPSLETGNGQCKDGTFALPHLSNPFLPYPTGLTNLVVGHNTAHDTVPGHLTGRAPFTLIITVSAEVQLSAAGVWAFISRYSKVHRYLPQINHFPTSPVPHLHLPDHVTASCPGRSRARRRR